MQKVKKTQRAHDFFACPWCSIISSQIPIEFLKMCFWHFLFTKWSSIIFLDQLLNFFLMKCCWNFCSQSALDFFLMICFSIFSLVYLGNIDPWNFSLQNLGYVCFNYFEVVYVHWVITSLDGHLKGCNASQWWWFWSKSNQNSPLQLWLSKW